MKTEIQDQIETMIQTLRELSKEKNGEMNHAWLAGALIGMFDSMKYFDNADQWLEVILKTAPKH